MLTIHGAPAGLPILVGTLGHHRRGLIPGRPYQTITSWCPACRDRHSFGVGDVFPPDAIELVDAPCASGPWAGSKVAVALDPARRVEHRRVADDFSARIRRWRVEQRFRHQLAESRAIGRRHLAEGWDVVPT